MHVLACCLSLSMLSGHATASTLLAPAPQEQLSSLVFFVVRQCPYTPPQRLITCTALTKRSLCFCLRCLAHEHTIVGPGQTEL